MNTKLNNDPNWLELAQKTNWSVSGLAKACGVSVRTLELHFLKKLNCSPKAWLLQQRQQQALPLLRAGSSVKETAATLGYKSGYHLSRDFKKHWGYCPSQIDKYYQKIQNFAFRR